MPQKLRKSLSPRLASSLSIHFTVRTFEEDQFDIRLDLAKKNTQVGCGVGQTHGAHADSEASRTPWPSAFIIRTKSSAFARIPGTIRWLHAPVCPVGRRYAPRTISTSKP